MKKKFECGHIGKGQYCHLCRAKDDAYERLREEKRAEKSALEQRLSIANVDLSGIPRKVAVKAVEIIEKINSGVSYTQVKGHRLTSWDRDIISIPVGWSYRIMCRDTGDRVVAIEVLTHEAYNGRISLARR